MTQVFVYIALGIGGAGPYDYGADVTQRADKWPIQYDGTTKTRDQWIDVFYRRIDDGPDVIHVYIESEALGAGELRENMDKGILALARESIGRTA